MHISTTLPSQFDAVARFIATVSESLRAELSLSDEQIFHTKLVLEEALTNAVKHGNKFHPDLNVEVIIDADADQIVMTVKDQGPGFDPDRLPNPIEDIRLTKTSGRGVFLIKKLMDRVEFSDHGRQIRMTKILNGSNSKQGV